ncbi:ABC transporter [Hirsutella rhossiliensis]|uniref:ABC transporter domain-containing protein n=1 Tax=Hirsutella rhossiliensis TaxID=111463 RepID=A0A9P8SG40_9HYPO|nr:ABC transporter domain-containing protein [Hirsutella rhossiliensis]KAH0961578.1 ABC transporter domain-containing protein [Hirsutella rhossiliensis]
MAALQAQRPPSSGGGSSGSRFKRLAAQTWTLMCKNWRSLLLRHLLLIVIMALLLPILLSAFFSFAKNLFVPPATYGIGSLHPILTLPQAFDAATYSGRHKIVLVSNGHPVGGNISRVLDDIARQTADYGDPMRAVRVNAEDSLVSECRSTLRGVTSCFAAVVMRSSPTEGPGNIWNYTIRTDASLAQSPLTINIESHTNPEQVYLMPLQRAIDAAIARLEGRDAAPLARTNELPFTSQTQEERDRKVREVYHSAIVNFMGVAFISTVIWITYHLTGLIATERESGMSQLIDAMMPLAHPWEAQAARILAHHLSFSAIYAPAWVLGSLIIRFGVFVNTNVAIVIFHHLFAGLSLASFSILFAAFFNKAQLSSITTILATLLLAILAQSITAPDTATVAVLSVLFSPCNYVYFITLLARFEKQDRAANLTEMPPDSPWEIPGIVFWVLMVAQIFIYPLLAAFVERWRYGTSTKGRHMQMNEGRARSSLAENAVELDRLTKTYYPSLLSRLGSMLKRSDEGAEPVVAVKELSLNAPRGQIVTLLGANGSGKSTTLDAIAGLHKITSGSITIDGTGGLGIAPQKNVLWDDLTVEEHLVVFNRLKSPESPASKEEIAELIKSIDLHPKRKSLAKTLSGGQRRKLQLGMMLTGGSAVCCVDEVSSGLDPLSRRKIWDILLAERGRRTLILTTHFLDEADLLADHIAILSKGTLRAAGSSVELKDRLGGGYRVRVHKNPSITDTPDIEGVQKKEAFDLTTYVSPTSSLAAEVVKRLDAAGITDYRFSGPTIEDVFLRLAEEIKDEQVLQGADNGALMPEKDRGDRDDSSQSSGEQQNLKLMDGTRIGYVKQAAILMRKRITIFKRNWILYVVAFCLPIFAAALTSLYVRNKDPMGCSAAQQLSSSATQDAFSQISGNDSVMFLAGPRSRFDPSSATRLLAPIFAGSSSGAASRNATMNNIRVVDTFDDFKRFITDNRKNLTTGLWLGDSQSPPTVGWVANLFITSSLTAQQFLDVLMINTTIATTWSPFDVPFNPGIGDALNLVVYMGIALACYPAFFGLYPSNERRRFVRALQYSNGVRPLPLWAAYLVFDFTIALAATAIAVGLWAALSNIWYHLEYVFVVFFLYGLASTILAYFVSLFTKTQLSSFAWAAAYQGILFLAYLIAYVCIITYVNANKIDSTILICHFIISLFAPIGSAMRALFISTNLFSAACDGQQISARPGSFVMYGGPITYLVIQCFVLFGLLIWFDSGSVGSSIRELLHRRKGMPTGDGEEQDEEMAQEVTRVASGDATEDGLRVMHLTKSFGRNTAVDNVTFGIKRGEVFALLGPNGAGKSTTISLIRGDIKPSGRNGGDVLVEDKSVTKDLAAARTHLGVCPQIDALDQMTVREHLEFYARVRGIPDVQHNVSAVLRAVGLEAFETRMGHALSGGNKRKLSLGIALMGNPTVVLLDEPSSGLDAASKRIMWRTLAGAVAGRSILLTTHSMEEADALAGRAGILARRMLALGTPDDLRHRFGDALHVHLVASTAPRTSDEDMERISSWVRATFPSATVDAKTYHGQMRFSVEANDIVAAVSSQRYSEPARGDAKELSVDREPPASNSLDIQAADTPAAPAISTQGRSGAIGQLVVLLEEHKARLGVEHYSVSPTTLDQVFLTIVGRHNVREENYEEPKKRGIWSRIWNFGRS